MRLGFRAPWVAVRLPIDHARTLANPEPAGLEFQGLHRVELVIGAVMAVLAVTVDVHETIGFSSFGRLLRHR